MFSTPGSKRGIKNLNGISRDHMLSKNYGFKNNIDPYIISHPANCKLITHTENNKKHTQNTITLEELKNKIILWNVKYEKSNKEHNRPENRTLPENFGDSCATTTPDETNSSP